MQEIFGNNIGVFHIVGIGGIGMSAIAKIMLFYGYKLQGSNIIQNSNTVDLSNIGIKVYLGHDEANVVNADYVILSSIIKEDNVEVMQAKKLNIPILKRHDILSLITKNKYVVAISGSHGKTTTSAIITHLLLKSHFNPTSIVGGIMNLEETNAFKGNSKYFILESDESDGTFNMVPRASTVVTNIDKEHLEYFRSYDDLLSNFKKFILEKSQEGFSVISADDNGSKIILNSFSEHEITQNNILSFGIENQDSEILAHNIRYYDYNSVFDIKSKSYGQIFNIQNISIPLPGKHNVLNALAGIIVALKLGVKKELICSLMDNFQGVQRRFNKILEYKESVIIDDYAHHPTEIDVVLTTAKNIQKNNFARIILFFQPHRVSRVESLFPEFVTALSKADVIFISDVYDVAVKDNYSVNNCSKELVRQINKINNNCYFLENIDNIPNLIKSYYQKHDMFVVMGAGDIFEVIPKVQQHLKH